MTTCWQPRKQHSAKPLLPPVNTPCPLAAFSLRPILSADLCHPWPWLAPKAAPSLSSAGPSSFQHRRRCRHTLPPTLQNSDWSPPIAPAPRRTRSNPPDRFPPAQFDPSQSLDPACLRPQPRPPATAADASNCSPTPAGSPAHSHTESPASDAARPLACASACRSR